ncbi:hypothetical protein BH09PSE2_BH09PSE2_03480 [soil metagenome]
MTDTSSSGGVDGLPAAAAQAQGSVSDLQTSGVKAAEAIDSAFGKAGESLAKSLGRAASDGKISLAELAKSVIDAAGVFARQPTGASGGGSFAEVLAGVFKSVFSGARADGGPVGAGGAYLVGERGPELFRPYTAGEISPGGGAGSGAVVNVTIQGGGAPAILRSEAQIAAALARAVTLGGR